MAIAPERPAAALPALPCWGRTPPDAAEATRQVKSAIRTRVPATGRTVEKVFAVAEQQTRAEGEDIAAASQAGETIWPVINYADIASGTVPVHAGALLAEVHQARHVLGIPPVPGLDRPLRNSSSLSHSGPLMRRPPK